MIVTAADNRAGNVDILQAQKSVLFVLCVLRTGGKILKF